MAKNTKQIVGNLILENNRIKAVYKLAGQPWSNLSSASKYREIRSLTRVFKNTASDCGELTFHIIPHRRATSKQAYASKVEQTNRNWDPNFKFKQNPIKNTVFQINCYIIVNIESSGTDMLGASSADLIKQAIKKATTSITDVFTSSYDIDGALNKEQQIYNDLNSVVDRANRAEILDLICSNAYPSSIVDSSEYDDEVLKGISQEFIPQFGAFQMTNTGRSIFPNVEEPDEPSYGAIMEFTNLPEIVDATSFRFASMIVDDKAKISVSVHIPNRKDVLVQIKRKRADMEDEVESIAKSKEGSLRDSDIPKSMNIVKKALSTLNNSNYDTLCNSNVRIAFFANTEKELQKKCSEFISNMMKVNITVRYCADQIKAYSESFLNFNCKDDSRPFLTDLSLIFGYQLSNTVEIGDTNTNFTFPILGQLSNKGIVPYATYGSLLYNRAPGTIIQGQSGQGKTYCMNSMAANDLICGTNIICIDPKNDMLNLTKVDPNIIAININESASGMFSPYNVWGDKLTAGNLLDVITNLIGEIDDKQQTDIIGLLEDSVNTFKRENKGNMQMLMNDLMRNHKENARSIATRLQLAANGNYADLVFGDGKVGFDLDPNKNYIFSLAGLDLPSYTQSPKDYTQANRFASAIIYMMTNKIYEILSTKTSKKPLTIFMDEAHILFANKAMSDISLRLVAMGRSRGIATVFATQSISTYDPKIFQNVSTKISFASTPKEASLFEDEFNTSGRYSSGDVIDRITNLHKHWACMFDSSNRFGAFLVNKNDLFNSNPITK